MKIFPYILFFGLLAACNSGVSPEQKAVEAASELYKTNPSDSTAQVLITTISAFVQAKGYSDSVTPGFLLQGAQVATKHGRNNQALGFYKSYVVEFPDRPDVADRLADIITLVNGTQKPELSQVLYRSFASRFPNDNRTAGYVTKIENKEITADSILRFIGMNMFNDSTFRLNEEKARLYIDVCEAAVMANPALANAPEYLHRAAETARTLRDIPKAINLYDWIISKYPNHSRAGTSLFLKAFTYDNDIKDFDKAKLYYDEFLAKYPNNEFAESAKFLLANLGKSEEELRKMLEEKSKENVQ